MKTLLITLALISSAAVQAESYYWNLDCSNATARVIVQVVDANNESLDGEFSYDVNIKKSNARVQIITGGVKYEYSKTVFVNDEQQGNFRLQAFSFNYNEMAEVANVYYEHEGNYISGNIQLPTPTNNVDAFSKTIQFDEMECK